MKGASKVIMAATLVMVVTLAIVLGLVLVLLAELYCTLLLRRRRLHTNSSNGANPAAVAEQTGSTHLPHAQNHSYTPRSYATGVLEAPRSLFYPTLKEKHSQLHHFLQLNTSPQHIGEIQIQINSSNEEPEPEPEPEPESEASVVYISNPIFVNSAVETPFETPESSPSRLEKDSDGSGEACRSPVVTPMEKLPPEASSVSLRCLGTSGSDSNGLSSSSSGSPSTSPSW